ncbi:MAG: V-type ATP synthase subunit A [Spirochaetia bacterium]|nr:V-type ATP synthase subunit A [Spirochaetia bacterium]
MKGSIVKICGPTVHTDLQGLRLYERVTVKKLTGEVVRLHSKGAVIQVYEDTRGLGIGDEVESLDIPLSVTLGPGMLSSIYDGLQRPLETLQEKTGPFIKTVDVTEVFEIFKFDKPFEFIPNKNIGDTITKGEILGKIKEGNFYHYIYSSKDIDSKIKSIITENITQDTSLITFENGETIKAYQSWPVRIPRPFKKKISTYEPLITGQRNIDFLFSLAKGGTAIIPGGFGTGKTILEQSIAKFADVDIVIYVGCGERGNEMAELLEEFRELKDQKTNKPLLERTVLVVNTSNMPVAAREASIFTAVTIAEYYRDNGYDVLLLADSISRWAEALREISTSLEEMPGEEGYPTYLVSRLAAYTERAGVTDCINGLSGSLTMILSVSPPGGDFTEPVTQALLRNTGVFLMLDTGLAHRRHFPAINWFQSYSLYQENLDDFFCEHFSNNWKTIRNRCREILKKEETLREVAEIVGISGMQDSDRLLLQTAEKIRTKFLAQNAYSEDAYSHPNETIKIIENILNEHEKILEKLTQGLSLNEAFKEKRANDLKTEKAGENKDETK